MPLPVIANTWRVAVRGVTSHGTPFVNVIHLHRTAGAAAPADVPALVTELNKLYGGASYGGGGLNLLNNCNSSTVVSDYTFLLLDGISASIVSVAAAAGSGAAQALPAEVAEVITLRTPNRGRSYRGRIYLPAMTTGALIAGGNIAAAVTTALTAQCVGFQAAIGGLTYSWVVASYKLGLVNTITGFTMDPAPDVQRRRKA